jgi:hypothetical protein
MKYFTVMKNGLVLFLLIIFFLSCGGKVTTRTTPEEYKFTINGVVVKDLNSGKDIAYFAVLRDGNPFDSALVKVGSDTLINEGNGNYYLEGFPLFGFGQTVTISISSTQDDFELTKSVVIPGDFSIVELPEYDKLNVGGHSVDISWTPSVHASGFFLSMVRPDGLPGHTLRDEDKNRAEKIRPEAFRSGEDLVIGIYEVYVIAYFESFLHYRGITFELSPGLLIENLSGANGSIGAGVIASSVTIEVTSGQ